MIFDVRVRKKVGIILDEFKNAKLTLLRFVIPDEKQ